MKRFDSSFLVVACLCVQGVAFAQAPPYSYSPPRTSPYLNLLRRGSSPAVNYYGLVRPDIEYRSSIGQLQQQTQANQQAIAGVGAAQGAGVLTTGNVAGFMNYGPYFQNVGVGGAAGGGGAGFAGAAGSTGGAGAAGFQRLSGAGATPGAMGGGGRPARAAGAEPT